ncbi:MAG TPA: GxxExxY protein [Candidatus Hydrogenedentes bacterium]|nr:GxxExxY protein [Candidatus Hydrogenedentota bacterium]
MEHQDHDPLTQRVIGCALTVSNTLGAGFLEKAYENAPVHELRKNRVRVEQQYPVTVRYDGAIVGDFIVDLLVEDTLLVELKAVKVLDNLHTAQCLNYLKATGLRTCLLRNFGRPKMDVTRFSL